MLVSIVAVFDSADSHSVSETVYEPHSTTVEVGNGETPGDKVANFISERYWKIRKQRGIEPRLIAISHCVLP